MFNIVLVKNNTIYFELLIYQKEGKGNMAALKLRASIQSVLYRVGIFANNFSLQILVSFAILLTGCTYCLSYAEIETNIEKLWIEG